MAPSTHAKDPFPDLGDAWSRPRKLTRILAQLGMGKPARLSQRLFQDLVAALRRLGIEAQTMDEALLTADSPSPGIGARLRLRRGAGQGPDEPGASLRALTLANFKSYESARLDLSELTVLIGANASGKSNALEALQILCWMASGRRLGDLPFAVKEGELALRGTPGDLLWQQGEPIVLGCMLAPDDQGHSLELDIALAAGRDGLRIVGEELRAPEEAGNLPLYRVVAPASEHGREMTVEYNNFARGKNKPQISCVDEQPVFTQLTSPARFGATHARSQSVIPAAARRLRDALASVLFLDPSPRAMRGYSFKGQRRLAGNGANLSAVLYELTKERSRKREVLDFVRSIPEQDILDIGYLTGPRGEVMVQLTESFGGSKRKQAREAALLSDGTLRVLAMAAALLSVPDGSLVVIEELDNGVHPSRAADLLARIQEIARQRRLRILLTTHNPALLDVLPDAALPNVVACYRDPQDGSSRLVRLQDLPRYPELIARGPLGRLLTQGIVDRFLKSQQSSEERRTQHLAWVDEMLAEDDA